MGSRREAVERATAAFSEGDFDRAIEFAHPEIEYVPAGGQAPIRGAAQLRAWMEPDAFESQSLEAEEIHESENAVLVRLRAWNRAAASGIEMEVEAWVVWTFDESGLARRLAVLQRHERDAAFQAAGLDPQ
jgi:ketosteroid isomerase-like protein